MRYKTYKHEECITQLIKKLLGETSNCECVILKQEVLYGSPLLVSRLIASSHSPTNYSHIGISFDSNFVLADEILNDLIKDLRKVVFAGYKECYFLAIKRYLTAAKYEIHLVIPNINIATQEEYKPKLDYDLLEALLELYTSCYLTSCTSKRFSELTDEINSHIITKIDSYSSNCTQLIDLKKNQDVQSFYEQLDSFLDIEEILEREFELENDEEEWDKEHKIVKILGEENYMICPKPNLGDRKNDNSDELFRDLINICSRWENEEDVTKSLTEDHILLKE